MVTYEHFTLYADGKRAFPAILSAIEAAEKSLFINMFIWRDDEIGNRMAEAVLAAAERGVKVEISIDRYGLVLEKAEEAGRSFFHKRTTLAERVKIAALMCLYPENHRGRKKDECTPLYERLVSHPNITVERDTFKADHSKFYIIDGETLFVGGVNIEDKENGRDLSGREYGDYMVRVADKNAVDALLTKLKTGKDTVMGYSFTVNTKPPLYPLFEAEGKYLSVIREAEKELWITMAYFSPLPRFLDAITDAYRRGVKVTVMIPERANFQNDTNRKTARELLKRSNGGIRVLLSPRMLHTKLVMSEKEISFGSANITKKAFRQLSECNLTVKNDASSFCEAIRENERKNEEAAREVRDHREIRYRRLYAFLEGTLV